MRRLLAYLATAAIAYVIIRTAIGFFFPTTTSTTRIANYALTRRFQLVQQQQQHNENKTTATVSIIITSNLIPTHPSLDIINTTIMSLHSYLIGLPTNTPIYLTMDGLRPPSPPSTTTTTNNNNYTHDQQRHREYIQNLQQANFAPFTNIQVVPMPRFLHLAGSLNYTLQELEINTTFVYILQHDLAFCRPIHHVELMQAMQERPETLFNVRFRRINRVRTRMSQCPALGNETVVVTRRTARSTHDIGNPPPQHPYNDSNNSLHFFATSTWSDNNHIARTSYYKSILTALRSLQRPMEFPMDRAAKQDCQHWGQQVYGPREDYEPYLLHLDGRHAGDLEWHATGRNKEAMLRRIRRRQRARAKATAATR